MKKVRLLIILFFISMVCISQPIVNLLIQVVDENNNPIEAVKIYIKHPGWSQDHWIPDQGRYNDPSVSNGEFSDSFTMNSQRHYSKYNLYSSLSGISDVYSNFPYGQETIIDIKLTKSGYNSITDQLSFLNRDRNQYSLIERTYHMTKKYNDAYQNEDPYYSQKENDYYLTDYNNRVTIMLVSYFGRKPLFTFVDGYPLRDWKEKPVLREFDDNQHSFTGGSEIWISPGEHTITVKSKDGSVIRSKTFILKRGDYEQWNIK